MERNRIIILAGGNGVRMNSSLPKSLHNIANKPIIGYVLDLAHKIAFGDPSSKYDIVIVVNEALYSNPALIQLLKAFDLRVVIQKQALGTVDAILSVQSAVDLRLYQKAVLLYGDTPLLQYDQISGAIEQMKDGRVGSCNIAFRSFEEKMCGMLEFDVDGDFVDIKERKSDDFTVSDENGKVGFLHNFNQGNGLYEYIYNAGFLVINSLILEEFLLSNHRDITKVVSFCKSKGSISKFIVVDEASCIGVNTRQDLLLAEFVMQERLGLFHMGNGVTLMQPETTFFSYDTVIGRDSTIYPNTYFGLNVKLATMVKVLPFSCLEEVAVEKGASIGPFARISGRCSIGEGAVIGNFVEVKRSHISKDVKAKHMSYIGDVSVGQGTNIGAGAVFCNFDGKKKHKSVVDEMSFIGANASIVSPVKIGANSKVAAGSVITKDVPEGSLGISRTEQVNKNRKSSNAKND